MIIRREKLYYVVDEKTGREMGGPFKTRAQAKKRLARVKELEAEHLLTKDDQGKSAILREEDDNEKWRPAQD